MSEVGDVLIALEDMVTNTDKYKARPRGRCSRCKLDVLLTPGGYLASHSYIKRKGEPPVLFSWRACLTGDKQGVIARCFGGGQRPSRRHGS